ncbi:hypothetical protein ACPPVV_08865 [Rhodanobacter sp. Col0626]|uniref:hypothetical protein n=1 Tax=Rhodanobacter sp. Col0626 TaxID=3415679 RepID=UPI003CEA6EFF
MQPGLAQFFRGVNRFRHSFQMRAIDRLSIAIGQAVGMFLDLAQGAIDGDPTLVVVREHSLIVLIL